jgi:IS5 family transposase
LIAVREHGQFSFVDALMPQGKGGGRLDRLSSLVKWYRFEKQLARLRDEVGAGRPAYRPLVMFKALLLQSLYGLSDMELEEALCDRLSFKRFVGLALDAAVPDHSTLCRFRNRLIGAGLLDKLFGELDRQLDTAGLILRRGTMLDATVIETTAARPPEGSNRDLDAATDCDAETDRDGTASKRLLHDGPDCDGPGDPDARFTRRKGKAGSSYGYKAHVGVDAGSGLIRRIVTTPANVNDTVVADRLMRRPNRHHPVLRPLLARFNRLISKRRAAVETTFATLKNRMGLGLIRYRGLVKARAQVIMAAIAFNMRRWVTLAA